MIKPLGQRRNHGDGSLSARAPLPRAADRRGWSATSPHPFDGGVRGRARSDDRLARSRSGDAVESRRFSATRPGSAPDAEAHFSRGDATGLVWQCFVLPSGEVFGHDPGFRVCLPEIYREFGDKFASRGTLRAWQRIAELAVGNSRLMLAVALASPAPSPLCWRSSRRAFSWSA